MPPLVQSRTPSAEKLQPLDSARKHMLSTSCQQPLYHAWSTKSCPSSSTQTRPTWVARSPSSSSGLRFQFASTCSSVCLKWRGDQLLKLRRCLPNVFPREDLKITNAVLAPRIPRIYERSSLIICYKTRILESSDKTEFSFDALYNTKNAYCNLFRLFRQVKRWGDIKILILQNFL